MLYIGDTLSVSPISPSLLSIDLLAIYSPRKRKNIRTNELEGRYYSN